MNIRILPTLALAGLLGGLTGCPAGGDDDTAGSTGNPTTNPTDGSGTDTPTGTSGDPTGGVDGQLCTDLGGVDGITALIGNFVGRVLVDDRINAYFLKTDVDGGNLTKCLIEQISAATMCAGATYTCGDMTAVHAGMGISQADFDDLAGDFSDAMDEHQKTYNTLTDDEKAAILAVFGSMVLMIVEDKTSDVTVYQRLGRKPGIKTVVGDGTDPKAFIGVVVADAEINGFFGAANVPRLQTCLVRQVTGATAGGFLGDIYGKEVTAPSPADPGVTTENPCKDMVSSHKDLKDDMGVAITSADFNALVMDLVTAMTNFDVPMAEQNAIAGALLPLCPDIVVVDPENCP